jgi:hypothetical protein
MWNSAKAKDLIQFNNFLSKICQIVSEPCVCSAQAHTGRGIQGGRRWPQATRPAGGPPPPTIRPYGRLGVARPQGVEGLGMAGPGETLGSPWIPLPVRAWFCAV